MLSSLFFRQAILKVIIILIKIENNILTPIGRNWIMIYDTNYKFAKCNKMHWIHRFLYYELKFSTIFFIK